MTHDDDDDEDSREDWLGCLCLLALLPAVVLVRVVVGAFITAAFG